MLISPLRGCLVLWLSLAALRAYGQAEPATASAPQADASPNLHAAADAPAKEAIHHELRALRDAMVDAVNRGDLEALLAHVHPNIVHTPQNAETCRGKDAIRAYYHKMMVGPNRIVQSFETRVAVDDFTILYRGGDVGVAFGDSDDHYVLADGKEFGLRSRWTATVVREDGRWLVAAFHISADIFDNPLLNAWKRIATWTGVGGGVIGLIVGSLIALVLRRRRRPAAAGSP